MKTLFRQEAAPFAGIQARKSLFPVEKHPTYFSYLLTLPTLLTPLTSLTPLASLSSLSSLSSFTSLGGYGLQEHGLF